MSKAFNKNQLVINPNKPNKIYRVTVVNTGGAEECIMLTSINTPTNEVPDNITLKGSDLHEYIDLFIYIQGMHHDLATIAHANTNYHMQIDTMFDLTENQNHTISVLKRKLKRNAIARRLLSGFEILYFVALIVWVVLLWMN